MPTAFCPECRALLQFPEPAAGKQGRCLRCKKIVVFEASDLEWGPAEAQDNWRFTHFQVIAVAWYSLALLATFVSMAVAGNDGNALPGFAAAACLLLFGYLSTICGKLSEICENGRTPQPPTSRAD